MEKIKIVISDCHLSAGLHFESEKNPHEDFFFDDEMIAFFEYFSSGRYADAEVELIINGDYLDFLNVPYRGEFEEVITEQFALYKLECILAGHPRVMTALKRFAALPDKTILYNIGNHDADLFFPKVRERLIRAWDPEGRCPSPKIRVNYETPVIDLDGGVQIHHGNQLEAVHMFNYEKPIITEGLGQPVLNIPWGSFYVLKIVNRFKWERDYVDKVRPVKAMFLWGLLFDTWFTLKFMFLSVFYFMKTRFIYSPQRRSRLTVTAKILQQETTTFLQDLERDARELLERQENVQILIMGHTHHPMYKSYPNGKTYINTGTWTKMINLDLRGIGGSYRLTFALVEYGVDGKAKASLQTWMGEYRPYRTFTG
ncbi:MAG: metallophosphoesterase [Deltaproteobacteria bacterium]|nr:metallophosphoesterase [Deltaproteobacteria bacterium]